MRSHLVSAALRHVRDAEHLASEGPNRSLDQALHLAGFAPECVRKACFDERWADHALGHDIRDATDTVVDFLLGYDPDSHRYGVDLAVMELPLRAQHWRPDLRYECSGSVERRIGATGAREVIAEARRFVDQRVAALWCDGVITSEAFQ